MNHQRKNFARIAAIAGLALLSVSGCKYDRSFMNMDSNSGSPFFGLQLAVDSGSRPPKPGEHGKEQSRGNLPGHYLPAIPDRSETVPPGQTPILFTGSASRKPNGFERTSESRDLNTNIRYSLHAPVTDGTLKTQAVDLRMSAF